MTQYFKIGKFAASHGHSGELILKHSLGKKNDFKTAQAIFLQEAPDKFIPYFIEQSSVKNVTETFIRIEGITTMEQARKLTPKDVWLTEADFKKFVAKTAPVSMLGFDLMDGEKNLGEIVEVIEQPHQVLCVIMLKEKEALIPVHENNLLKLDAKNRKVYVEIPEGLLEIYS